MPEKTTIPYREKVYTLADADRDGQIIEAHCHYCKLTYNFRPADLIEVLGNRKTYNIADHFDCQKCKKREYMSAKLRSVAGSEYGKLPMRKLVRVYFVKRSEWTNGVL